MRILKNSEKGKILASLQNESQILKKNKKIKADTVTLNFPTPTHQEQDSGQI